MTIPAVPRRIKLLYIVGGLASGGKERQLVELLRNIDKEKYELGVITFNSNQRYSSEVKELCSFYRELSKRPTRLEPLFTIWKCFRKFKPDIIHSWDTLSSFYSFLPSTLYRIPLIDGSIRDSGVDKGIHFHFKRFFLRHSKLALANSKAGIKAYRVNGKVVYNFINVSRFLQPERNAGFNLVMTANFSRYKDQQTFLNAAIILVKENVADHVYLLGEGPFKEKYIHWISQEHGDIASRIHFEGTIPNVEEYLSRCQVGVMCSTPEFSEGLSNSVLEYMASGLVPIVTDIGGSAEIVEDNRNGFLIQAGDYQCIAKRVREIHSSPELRDRLSLAARKTIEEKFTLDKSLSDLYDIYQSVL